MTSKSKTQLPPKAPRPSAKVALVKKVACAKKTATKTAARKVDLRSKPKQKPLAAAELHSLITKTQRMVAETREQMAFMYAVLEEIAQRQEIQTSWQVDLAKQIFAPPKMTRTSPRARHAAQDANSPEIEISAEITAGEGVPQALLGEITSAAEKILQTLAEQRKETRAKGIESVKKILSEHVSPDDKAEVKIMIVPPKDEIH